jgi:DnaA family protein
MNFRNQQLTLPVGLHDDATFANYFPGANAHWVSYLQEFIAGHKEKYLFISGQPGAGCTHLLQACCRMAITEQLSAAYVSFQQKNLQPEVLENLEQLHLICLDDIHLVAGDEKWEESLFHLFNRVALTRSLLIISAPFAPQHLSIKLADLASRLASGLFIYLYNLKDNEKMAALQLRATRRGVSMTPEVGQFLLRRYPRDMTALFSVLEQLDQASLVAKRKLTIPFIKEVLAI